jgi:hypothetical protein
MLYDIVALWERIVEVQGRIPVWGRLYSSD